MTSTFPPANDTRVTQLAPRAPAFDRPCLVQLYGPALGKKFALDQVETLLGRDPSCAITLDIDNVSRRHCIIVLRDGSAVLRDEASTNGTYLNNLPVQGEKALSSGDLIRVGAVIFKFLSSGELGSIEAQYHEEIYRLAIFDGLTQVHNKRFMLEFLERELARCARHGHTVSLVMIDVDHFKKLNDLHGHLAGDAVLRELTSLLKTHVRRDECFARYGGEEFALVLPDTARAQAIPIADRFRKLVESYAFMFEGVRLPVTFSAGVAEIAPGELSPLAFLQAADKQLYEAKKRGRNQVVG
jgi:two-component system, cell cycle response regulator